MMNTQSALRDLGVNDGDLSETQKQQLDRDGYFVVENAFSEADCERMKSEIDRIIAEEGDRGGGEVSIEAGVTRISNVFNKTEAFDDLLTFKPMLAGSRYLLGEFKVHGANMREPHKGTGRQPLHSDSVKLADGGWCLTNSLIIFDAMTLDNGPTRIVRARTDGRPLTCRARMLWGWPRESAKNLPNGRKKGRRFPTTSLNRRWMVTRRGNQRIRSQLTPGRLRSQYRLVPSCFATLTCGIAAR